MHRHFSHFIVVLLVCVASLTHAQLPEIEQLDLRILKGDYSALVELGEFFDSKKKFIEYVGWHQLETTEDRAAKRVVIENTSFLPSELVIDEELTAAEFNQFLQNNKVYLSDLGHVFIVTPFAERTVDVKFREMPGSQLQTIITDSAKLLNDSWISDNLKDLIKKQDPKALLQIASEFYKNRSRLNRYSFKKRKVYQFDALPHQN